MKYLTDRELEQQIDPWVYSQLNHHCPYCGSPIINSVNMRTRKCSNPRCINKLAERANYMFKDLGIKNIGVATLRRTLGMHKMISHFELLNPKAYTNKIAMTTKADRAMLDIASTKYKVAPYKVIEYLGIDGIGKEASFERMKGIQTPEDINDKDLEEYKPEIRLGFLVFEVQTVADPKRISYYYVMMTNSIRRYSPR